MFPAEQPQSSQHHHSKHILDITDLMLVQHTLLAVKAWWQSSLILGGVLHTCDGAYYDNTLEAVFRGFLDIFQEQVCQQEVPQVVGGHAELVAVGCVAGLLGGGEVHRSVADQHVQPPAAAAEVLQQGLISA